jgi:hypothetical protein
MLRLGLKIGALMQRAVYVELSDADVNAIM